MDLMARVRERLPRSVEKKMFGGTAFMVDGAMACSVSASGLLVRLGKGDQEELLAQPGVQPMQMGEQISRNWAQVDPAVLGDDAALDAWVERGVAASRAAKR